MGHSPWSSLWDSRLLLPVGQHTQLFWGLCQAPGPRIPPTPTDLGMSRAWTSRMQTKTRLAQAK